VKTKHDKMTTIEFTKHEIHDMHMGLSELLDFFKDSKKHGHENPDGCGLCREYEKIRKRFLKECDCLLNTNN